VSFMEAVKGIGVGHVSSSVIATIFVLDTSESSYNANTNNGLRSHMATHWDA
jgi:hypothetical protein